MTAIDYLPLLIAPAAGLAILIGALIAVLRDKAKRDRQHPAE